MLFRRVDPALNMYRWYNISIQSTLFDSCVVICTWGRMRTSYQRMRILPVDSVEEAEKSFDRLAAKRLRHGYIAVSPKYEADEQWHLTFNRFMAR